MRVKSEFMLSTMAGSNIVVPTGKLSADFHGMLTLNDTGAFLWKQLQEDRTEDELVASVLAAYPDTDPAYARDCVREFVEKLQEADCLA